MKIIWKKLISDKYLWWMLLAFFFIYSVGIFHKFGRLSVYGDEVHVIFSVLKFFRDFNFTDPYAYAFPVMTILYIPFVAGFFVFLFMTGQVHNITELQNIVILETYKFVPIFRFTTIIFALISLYFFYKICLFIFKQKKWALLGLYLLGTSFVFIKISFVAIKWIPQVMLMLGALYYFLLLSKKKIWQIKDYFYSAILVSVNYGVAIVGAGVILPFFLIWHKQFKNGVAGNYKKGLALFSMVTIFLIFLITLSSPTLAQATFSFLSNVALQGVGERMNESTLLFRFFGYFKYFWYAEPILFVLFPLGLVVAYKKNKHIFYLLFTYFLLFYLGLGPILGSIRQRRLVLLLPIIIIFVIFFISWLAKFRIGKQLISIILLLVLCNPFLLIHELKKDDSKMIAKQWIDANIPNNSVVFDTCELDLPDSFEKINYIQENSTELLTTEHRYLLAHPELAIGNRFAVFIDNNNLDSQKFNDYFASKEQYLVFCYENTEPESHKRWLVEEDFFNKLYSGSYKLEKKYDFREHVKYFGDKPHYLTYEVDPWYLIRSFKQNYTDYNFNIYKINLD